ncbi:hypothetical protein PI95_004545 [Hassallia byssoidea VB512170]|uniref:Uncharacterized protein n=1 Tax=Hassallia byssoidea VB512170 TaxID=1304833 RepID=A0A846H5J3_9CYAN|nr:hypothetical protein [Hassalia byssoidea]NEU71860.1 hypothetical protein [Hassalia byssoidea VB512170]
MTQLFNFESYVECCQYARLFHQSPEQFIPQDGDLPRAYKAFLQNYATHPYLPEPIISANHPQELTINQTTLDYLSIGTKLTQGEKQRLFIIRDTVDLMTLSMSNLLEHKDGYLYSSAYYYWNYYSQIWQHKLTKPLVFVDLDNFVSDRLIPINFSRLDNSPYQIPILNTKKTIFIDSGYNSIESYNSICQSIARRILADNFQAIAQNYDTVNHLANYLQKTSFFQIIQPYINQECFDFIIEILYNSQIFYKKVTLSIAIIADIVSKQINIQYLKQLANTHPEYQFALISQYNIFPHIQQLLPFICLNPRFQQFNQIWQEKSKLNFPLFAIYLDEIEFAIGITDEQGQKSKQWIQLSNQKDAISYEGKPTVLIGCIPSKNQNFFRIPQKNKTAKLPIKVNGNDYCINNVPQDYNIEIQNSQKTEDVCIRIEFHLQPGSFPELKVTDLEGKYKITASLTDRRKLSYSYIPHEKIISTRQQESLAQINRLKTRNELEFQECLVHINGELENLGISKSSNRPINYATLKDLLKKACEQIHKSNNRPDMLKSIDADSDEAVVSNLRAKLKNQSLHKIIDIICELFNSNTHRKLNLIQQGFLLEAIKFTGKLYNFSQYLLPNNLFEPIIFSRAKKVTYLNLENEYLQCLARVAINEELQRQYFSCFNSYYKLEKSQYLWGYGRILLWYYNFDAVNLVNFRAHFTAIMEYLLNKSPSEFEYQYKQNAFLSLLYLLSFRANDKSFCQHNYEEMRMAERVISHFSKDRIILKQVSQEKPLNQFFQEMIKGTITEDDLGNLLHG